MTVMLNYGNAALGDKNFTANTVGLNTCAQVTAIAADNLALTIGAPAVGTVGAFAVGDAVMIHVSGGASATYVGNYDFFKIASINGSTVVLDKPCTSVMPYDKLSGHVVQIVKVAQYDNVTVASGVTVEPFDYDGTKGGILALRVRTKLTLNGTINASKRGYHSGHAQPNGGGTSNWSYNNFAGGGGGSNHFPGGRGGNDAEYYTYPGGVAGNTVGTATLSKMYFGGSGGRGMYWGSGNPDYLAGIGGGIVYIVASTLYAGSTGRISANGGGGGVSGDFVGNGGGAGGCIYLGCPAIFGASNYLLGANGGGGAGAYGSHGTPGLDGTNSGGGAGGWAYGSGGGAGYQCNGGGGGGLYTNGSAATASSGGAGANYYNDDWGGGGGGGGGYIAVYTNANLSGYTIFPAPYTEPVITAISPQSGDRANPAIVVTKTPQFKWHLDNLDPTISEVAYQIQVYDGSGTNLVWDSTKKDRSDFIVFPPYANLEWDKLYQWRVQVWVTGSNQGTYSPVQYFIPSRLPYISAVSPGNENYKTPDSTSTIPRLAWTYGDPDGNPQTKFQVIVSDTLTAAVVHDTGIRQSNAGYYDVPRDVLQNHVDYKWCVTVWDERGLSATSPFRYLATNALPDVVTLVSPTNGQRADQRPVFVAQIGDDLENDAQHFKIQMADDANFTVNVKEFSSVTSQAGWEVKAGTDWMSFPVGGTSSAYEGSLLRYTWQSELPIGKVYYWRMAPIDATTGAVGKWSEVRHFLTGNLLQFRLKHPIQTTDLAEKIVLRAFYKLAQDGTIPASLKVEVCNNGLDAAPTWEDATDKLVGLQYYPFKNRTKTADDWAVDVRFTIRSNDSVGQIEVNAFGFAFM